MTLESIFDKETLEQMKACTRAKFPQCLSETLRKMFGDHGKETLDAMIMNKISQESSVSSPRDIWKLYEEYLDKTADRLGIDVAKVIQFESLNEMESMLCTKCPLYEKRGKS